MLDSDYYVIFMDSDRECLKWLKPGFRHCMVVRNEYNKVWTVIQDTMYCLDVRPYLFSEHPTIEALAGNGATIVPVKYNIKSRHRGHICLFNCVEVVKAVLGIKKPFIYTPYQLYRFLNEHCNRSD